MIIELNHRSCLFHCQGGRRTITREQLEESVEEVTIGDKFTGQFRVNYDTLVDVEKCVRMAQARYSIEYCHFGHGVLNIIIVHGFEM